MFSECAENEIPAICEEMEGFRTCCNGVVNVGVFCCVFGVPGECGISTLSSEVQQHAQNAHAPCIS